MTVLLWLIELLLTAAKATKNGIEVMIGVGL